ncbi:MAG: PEP-CTERM sorting domain-containing protein [Akkermansiaceae bacterium]|nr:PEP-CTERM sorting domain-containing protein [Akkermansiaceae bacterium]
MKAKLLLPALMATLATAANAAFVNHYPTWSTTGDATVVDNVSFLTSAFSDGTDDLTNQNNSGVNPTQTFDLETFVGLPSGGFIAAGADVAEGSAMKQTFNVLAGEIFTFSWQFLTNDTSSDLAFIVLDGVFTELVNSSTAVPAASYGYASALSGTYTSAAFANDATVTLAIGVADTGDSSSSSALRVLTVVPEPSAFVMLGLGLAGWAGARRRK